MSTKILDNPSSNSDDKNPVIWSSESVDIGKKAEKDLYTVFEYYKVPFISAEERKKGVFSDGAVSVATEEEDKNNGTDFFVYVPKSGWLAFDLTTSHDHTVLSEKEKKEKRGIKIIRLSAKTLDLAARGCKPDKKRVIETVLSAIATETT